MAQLAPAKTFDVIIVGGGIAAVSCAEQLCTVDPERSVLLVAESHTLKGIRNVIHITDNISDFDIYEQSLAEMESKHKRLVVRQASVLKVDSSTKTLLARGLTLGPTPTGAQQETLPADSSSVVRVGYGDLCVCSGARPHKIFPNHRSIIGIRDSDSVDTLRSKLRTARRLALVGNGGIALELVCELRKSGVEVVWITKDHFIGNTFLDASASEWLSRISTFIRTDATDAAKHGSAEQCESAQKVKRPKRSCCAKHARVPQHRPQSVSNQTPVVHGAPPLPRSSAASGHAVGPEWTRDLRSHMSVSSPEVPHRNVVWKPGVVVTDVLTNDDGQQWDIAVKLSNGETVECDFLISATGVVPNAPFLGSEFKRSADDGGIVVNRRMQTPGVPNTFCAGDVCTVDSTLPLRNADGTTVVPEPSPLWFQMRLWSQARTMGQLAALSVLEMNDIVDASMFFELFTHVSTFFGFKVTLLGAFNGQQLPHSGEVFPMMAYCSAVGQVPILHSCAVTSQVQTQIVTQDGPKGPCKPSATLASREGTQKTQITSVPLNGGVPLHAAGPPSSADARSEDVSKPADLQILVRVTPGHEYVKLVMWKGRIAGALLIGDTDLEETFENLILSQFDCSDLGIDLLDPQVDIEDYFD